MGIKTSPNPFDHCLVSNIPIFVLVELVTELRSAYQIAFKETIDNPLLTAGSAREHFPQERRLRVQQALVKVALNYSMFLQYGEKRTKPKGGRFITLTASNLVLVEKFLSNPLELPTPKYVSYLTAQPSIFEPELYDSNPTFAVIVHGYDKKSIFQDRPDFIDIVFPDPVDPANLDSALHRVRLLDLEFENSPNEQETAKIPEIVVTLKEDIDLTDDTAPNNNKEDFSVDLERGDLN